MTFQTCVCDRHTAGKPPYNIRGFEFRAISGLGRIGGGGGLVSDFEHHHHVVHMGLGRASWHGTQGHCPPLRRPLCPSWRAGFSPIPTKSGASRASGWILGSWERRRPGPASAASRSSLQTIVGAIVGRRLELGADTYRVLVHPTPPRGLSPRVRGDRCQSSRALGRYGSIPACAGEPPVQAYHQQFV